MTEGIIIRALSGFYYVKSPEGIITCKARGKFRLDGTSPLVGDYVEVETDLNGTGTVKNIRERRNWFIRPTVANIDALVFVASNSLPVTDPFLIDRVSVITEKMNCELIICINKSDLKSAQSLVDIYSKTPYRTIVTSAATGEGMEELRAAIKGKVCAFTGNSGVGKSSILNYLNPRIAAETGEISEKLGRGKHTTRYVELYEVDEDTYVADTPGFASFELDMMQKIQKEELQNLFTDFSECIGHCRFTDCAHLKEPGCAVTEAVAEGKIAPSRYESYVKLYDLSSKINPWD